MPEYVSKWHISLSCLQSANFYIDIKLCLNQFVHGLPNIAAFNTLWADLQNHVTAAGDCDFGAFVSLTETTLELDSIFRSILHTNQVHSHPPPQQSIPSSVPTTTPSVPAPAPPILSTPHSAAVPYSAKLCSNCGRRGHLAPTCFKAGGGMEGQRAEYKKDRNKVVAMLLADLDDSINSLDESELESNAPVTELFSESIVPNTLDDHIIIPNTANYSVSPESAFISQNDNIHRDLYPLCEPSEFLVHLLAFLNSNTLHIYHLEIVSIHAWILVARIISSRIVIFSRIMTQLVLLRLVQLTVVPSLPKLLAMYLSGFLLMVAW